MPSAREITLNTALSGDELRQIILADVPRLLAAEGMLASNTAFGRVSYTLALKLHLDNPFFPSSVTTLPSVPATPQQVEATPALAAIERPPLAPSSTRAVGGTVAHRDITSPNVERVRLGIPVPVLVEQQDGTKTTERIKYPASDASDDDGLRVVDETEARRLGWNIIEDTGE